MSVNSLLNYSNQHAKKLNVLFLLDYINLLEGGYEWNIQYSMQFCKIDQHMVNLAK